MTIELKLVHDTTTLSLRQSANAGWRLESEGWYPAVADIESEEPVTEKMRLVIDAASHDALAADVQELDYMRKWARRYANDPTSEHPVWLHAKMQEETGVRRALVDSIGPESFREALLESDTSLVGENAMQVEISITRFAWEEASYTTASAVLAESAGTVIAHDYTAGGSPHDVAGDLPARPGKIVILSDATGANVAKLWMGLRSAAKHGTLGNFVPTWECENGTNNAAETGISDDAASDVNGASPGAGSGVYVELTPTDLDWDTVANGGADSEFYEVMEIKLGDIVGTNERDMFGDFLWLMRQELVANATTWEVQLRWGYSAMADAAFVRGPVIEVSGTSWNYGEMGRNSIPLRNIHAIIMAEFSEAYEATYAVQIWARRTSGAADIHFDCLCLVPLDEGWLKSWDFDLADDAAEYWVFGEGPGGEIQALAYGSSLFTYIAAVAASRFRLPVGDGRMYIVYSGLTAHDLTKGLSLPSMHYYESWANLRGAE